MKVCCKNAESFAMTESRACGTPLHRVHKLFLNDTKNNFVQPPVDFLGKNRTDHTRCDLAALSPF
jgi:hypothetical protein